MKIGIYGGTYNPPHTGHMQAAAEAVRLLKLDKLLLIPDRIAPHKEIPTGSPTPEQRLEMLRIAAGGQPEMEVSDIELKREGPSFSYLTVEQLRAQYPDAELILLMGTDMFLSFHTWREPERITKHATLGVFYRGEKGEKEKIQARRAEMEKTGAKVELLENKILSISSTQLRRLLAFRCADEFLPAGVGAYIREKEDGAFKVSLRSNGDVDVAKAAVAFGGGGHIKASGFLIRKDIETVKTEIVEELKKQL